MILTCCGLSGVVLVANYIFAQENSTGDVSNYCGPTAAKFTLSAIELDQIPPHTKAERELERMLQGNGKDFDLSLANWLIAADIPEFASMGRQSYFARLDAMTDQVKREMAAIQQTGWSGADPKVSGWRCRLFCNAMIRLRFAYAAEFRVENLNPAQSKALYAAPDNIFLAGLLRTKRGSCVSMPLVYLVIGRRLDFPVYLVAIGRHYFIRWQEPGYRMDIETTDTDKVCDTPDDSVYLQIEGKTRARLRGNELRNLTDREVVGELYFTRMSYWHTKGEKYEAQSRGDLAQAHSLAPDDPAIEAAFCAILKGKNAKPQYVSTENKPIK